MTGVRPNVWLPHSLAYAFATSFFFGLAAVLNAAKIGFFFYYPRQIQITLIDSGIDVLIWVASALFLVRCEGEEAIFLSDIIIATFVLVAFNSTVRSLSQLLIDPHNARL